MNKEKQKEAVKQNMFATMIFWCLFSLVGIVGMVLAASRKTIVIADASPDVSTVSVAEELAVESGSPFDLQAKGMERVINIPLEKGTKAESVVIENHYMKRELWIHILDATIGFYQENGGYGNLSYVSDASCDQHDDGVFIKFDMSRVLEYRTTLEDDVLRIAYYEPHELYDLVVVIDPAAGGMDSGLSEGRTAEKDIVLQVAKNIQNAVTQENIKLYFTRLDDIGVDDEERIWLPEEVKADAFIRLCVAAKQDDPEAYGILGRYNATFFIPGMGNAQLADIVTRNVTISSSNKAVGLEEATRDSILQGISVPATEVSLGYVTNEQESSLLRQDMYVEKLAEGLAKAILEVYTNEHE